MPYARIASVPSAVLLLSGYEAILFLLLCLVILPYCNKPRHHPCPGIIDLATQVTVPEQQRRYNWLNIQYRRG